MNERKPRGYWTKERCATEALNYTCCSDFYSGNSSAASIAHRNGWLEEITGHFKPRQKVKTNWTRELCLSVSKNYSSRVRFKQEQPNAYRACADNGWLPEVTAHMPLAKKPEGYWTKERCHAESKKYRTRGDFQRYSKTAFVIACRNGWLPDIYSHMEPVGNLKFRWIYEIADHDKRLIYIGLTCDHVRRRWQHRQGRLVQYFGRELELNLLTDLLPVEEAQKQEDVHMARYRQLGYTVLNLKAGGALGKAA